jgi:uncharacterized membrane protein
MGNTRNLGAARLAVLATAVAAAIFLAGSYVAPLIESAGWPGAGLLRLFYTPACHQDPERCFQIGRGVQAICARCAGLYWGGVAGLLVATFFVVGRAVRMRPVWLAIAVGPTVIDALLPWAGLPQLAALPRHLLAWPAGFVAGLFLAVGIADLAISLRSYRSCGPSGLRTDSVLEGSDG